MEVKSQFENTSGKTIGVVLIDSDGKSRGAPLRPTETVWLSEHEQALTANAPRHDADNPFANGHLTLKVRAGDVPTHRPIGDSQDLADPPAAPENLEEEIDEVRVEQAAAPEKPLIPETGGAAEPTGRAAEGEFASHEEAETPDAPAAERDTVAERGSGTRPSSSPEAAKPAPPDTFVPPKQPDGD